MSDKTNERILEILRSIESLRKEFKEFKTAFPHKEQEGYTNQQVMCLFKISSATLKKWRDQGYIGYSLLYNTYFYSKKDIEEFLEKTHYDAFNDGKDFDF